MVADSELSKLGALLKDVGERLETGSAQAVLRAIFSTNNEIGRLSRTRSELRSSLVQLQLELNLVTVLVKSDRFPDAREAFTGVEKAFSRVSLRGASGKEFIERRGRETD